MEEGVLDEDKADAELESKLLKALRSTQTEPAPEEWKTIRKEALAKVEARRRA